MKLKNIAVGDIVQVKKSMSHSEFEAKQLCEVIDIDPKGKYDLIVLIQGINCLDWVSHKDLKKPNVILKQLDQSVFNGLDSEWKYAAVDANGDAHLYTHHMTPDSVEFAYCDCLDFDCVSLGIDYDATDWENSLIKRDTAKQQPKQLDHSMFEDKPNCWKFTAVDENGDAWLYLEKPYIGDTRWLSNDTIPFLIGNGYDATNWKDSLIERSTAKELLEVDLSSELTGSELCKAMLARGDTRIMCIVGDKGSRDDVTHVIRVYEDGRFHTKANSWEYAVPINNHGEPLTASEVGL